MVAKLLPGDNASPVAITDAACDAILSWAKAAGGHEACGLLFGDSSGSPGRIARATRARNVAAEPWHRFEIDPAHLFPSFREHRAGPPWIVGCWHSHPGGSPTPSARDRAGVTDMAWLWLIAAGGGVRAFLPTPAGFAELALSRVRG